jgi:hypothetical protein
MLSPAPVMRKGRTVPEGAGPEVERGQQHHHHHPTTTTDNQKAVASSAKARNARGIKDDSGKKVAAKTDVEFVAPLNGFNWTCEDPGRRSQSAPRAGAPRSPPVHG